MSELKTAYECALEKLEAREIIPMMTHPLSNYWDQPDRSLITIDDTHALMSQATFVALAEYSCSIPTGAYEGKMWKRENGAHDYEFIARGGKPEWMLMWYGNHADPDKVSINSRLILVV